MKPFAVALAALALASCGQEPAATPAGLTEPASAPAGVDPPDPSTFPPLEPPAPGTPGGLPDDRTPISEAPFTPQSAQGAANVMQAYYALIGEKKFAEAWDLWSGAGKASGLTRDAFVAGFDDYFSYNALIGAPGMIEGAAGSLFVEVPVQVYARRKTGEAVYELGVARLRRVNDAPGSTPEQRQWRIAAIELKPTP